jgi:hypothetical protein
MIENKSVVIARKPPLSYSTRYKNGRLSQLTIPQLRKKARNKNIDTTRLTHKWEMIHVLVEHGKNTTAINHCLTHQDTASSAFLDLPPEVRNSIYTYALQSSTDFQVGEQRYLAYGFKLKRMSMGRPPSDYSLLRALANMSWMCRQVRSEARSFFFASNRFLLAGFQFGPLDGVRFLDRIGPLARTSITCMKLFRAQFDAPREFLQGLQACPNLEELHIGVYMEHLCSADSLTEMRKFLRDGTLDSRGLVLDVSPFLEHLKRLHKLNRVVLSLSLRPFHWFDVKPPKPSLNVLFTRALEDGLKKMFPTRDVIIMLNPWNL